MIGKTCTNAEMFKATGIADWRWLKRQRRKYPKKRAAALSALLNCATCGAPMTKEHAWIARNCLSCLEEAASRLTVQDIGRVLANH
jgi:DNA-binding transcriptional MocR family regulator